MAGAGGSGGGAQGQGQGPGAPQWLLGPAENAVARIDPLLNVVAGQLAAWDARIESLYGTPGPSSRTFSTESGLSLI